MWVTGWNQINIEIQFLHLAPQSLQLGCRCQGGRHGTVTSGRTASCCTCGCSSTISGFGHCQFWQTPTCTAVVTKTRLDRGWIFGRWTTTRYPHNPPGRARKGKHCWETLNRGIRDSSQGQQGSRGITCLSHPFGWLDASCAKRMMVVDNLSGQDSPEGHATTWINVPCHLLEFSGTRVLRNEATMRKFRFGYVR